MCHYMLTVFNYYLDSQVCHNWLPMSYMYVNLFICRDLILLPVEFARAGALVFKPGPGPVLFSCAYLFKI